MAKRWIAPKDIQVPADLEAALGEHPLVARTLAQRGFDRSDTARAFLDPDHYSPSPPFELPNLETAIDRLDRAIRRGERICVWGDFDVDGQTSTTLLVSVLQDMGADPIFYIPHRERESHGIHVRSLKTILSRDIDLLLTCDTGVSAHEAIDLARGRGVDVIVTDHHDLPPELPPALAVIDPKMLPNEHPLHELPGVGVAYKLAEALTDRLGKPNAADKHLDLVALGIVADVALQVKDTRYLLQRGLEVLRHTERPGLLAIMELAQINRDWLDEGHIGFQLGPRLNALGRLADASIGVELLTTQDMVRARTLATEVEGLNAQRRLLVRQVEQAALTQIEREPALLEHAALVLSHPEWPGGIIGIVAGRLAERYNRPTILIAAPPGEIGRGSARSVEGCHITQAIAAQRDMLGRFGGHPMAAGLSIETERIPEFRRALSRTVGEMMGEAKEAELSIDAFLSLNDLTLDLVKEIEMLAPFGAGNPSLVFATHNLSLASDRSVGRNQEHRRTTVEDNEGRTQNVFRWNSANQALPEGRFDLAYAVRGSYFKGEREVLVEWIDARPIKTTVAVPRKRARCQVVDYRDEVDPHGLLRRIRTTGEVQVWCEADDRKKLDGHDRTELCSSKILVIWTIPPGPVELETALKKVSPETCILIGVNPNLDRLPVFIRRLAGLVKHALTTRSGHVRLSRLAAATAHREMTVKAGLDWLEAQGLLSILESAGDEITVGPARSAGVTMQSESLNALLAETAAFRAFFCRAESSIIF